MMGSAEARRESPTMGLEPMTSVIDVPPATCGRRPDALHRVRGCRSARSARLRQTRSEPNREATDHIDDRDCDEREVNGRADGRERPREAATLTSPERMCIRRMAVGCQISST